MERIVLTAYVYQHPCNCKTLEVYGPGASTIKCSQCKRWWSRNLGRIVHTQEIVLDQGETDANRQGQATARGVQPSDGSPSGADAATRGRSDGQAG